MKQEILTTQEIAQIKNKDMIKYILSTLVLSFAFAVSAQNVEFKAGNFKDDKEGFKKAATAIK